jgi:hypothetical protein
MRRTLAIVLMVLGVAACGSPVPPTASAASSAPLQVSCESAIAQTSCDEAVKTSLAAVESSGWTATQIWVSTGQLCPTALCVFDPSQNFPYPDPPAGGQWIGSAEIAFVQTDQHAGLNIASVGSGLVPVLIGYRVPLLTWCSGSCPTSSAVDGQFKLEFSVPHLAWKTGDAISGSADLELTGSQPTTVYGSGELIGYAFQEVGGTRQFGPLFPLDCAPFPLDPATPINVSLSKSGAVTATGSDAVFQQLFLANPEIRLPSGTWDITAIAVFSEGGCTAPNQMIRTTLRITVTG